MPAPRQALSTVTPPTARPSPQNSRSPTRATAGTSRTGSGTAGRIENRQIGVILAYTTPAGRTLLDRRLHLPEHTWPAEAAARGGRPAPEPLPRRAGRHVPALVCLGSGSHR
ncbi:hypothetical protein ACFSKW_43050 [Nonomuraea mangrovi]|uniref:Transposase n=1 Tax=Nonomuraea mangrovi TaxID=2316207 RepID=A0ABW4TB97_9ACTN